MTVAEAWVSVEFIVGRNGKPRAAVLNMAAWEARKELPGRFRQRVKRAIAALADDPRPLPTSHRRVS